MGPPGHFAIALLAKPAAPKAPLWVFLAATEVLDMLAFGFLALGIERTAPDPWFPWSHGLFMSAVWSLLVGMLTYLIFRDRRVSMLTGLLVFSHWVLDFISHKSDLPIFFKPEPKLGLGLEQSIIVGIILEFSMLAIGAAFYLFMWKRKTASHANA
jgi:hypothetical protein